MDPTTLFIMTAIGLIAKYGVPAAIEIFYTWKKNWNSPTGPTKEEILALSDLVPPTSSYFKLGN